MKPEEVAKGKKNIKSEKSTEPNKIPIKNWWGSVLGFLRVVLWAGWRVIYHLSWWGYRGVCWVFSRRGRKKRKKIR
jgi:hypothetical protein